jgi:DNA-binding response OmpR family regulator
LKQDVTILIVEDDKDIAELEKFHLEKEGFDVIVLESSEKVEEILASRDIAIILMDRMLPNIEGSEFVTYLRSKGYELPVMFVSAKDRDDDVVEGFYQGGDDYLTKPFDIRELVCRTKSILKRTHHLSFDTLRIRDIEMDIEMRKVYVEGEEVSLTKLEFDMLKLFMENKNKILKREYIINKVWKDQPNIQKRTVNVTIRRLKEKIDPENKKEYIVPVWGIGYRFL